jgi:hypothetical protein
MSITCLFCKKDVSQDSTNMRYASFRQYKCKRCGYVSLTEEAATDFEGEGFSDNDRLAMSITLRNNWEITGQKFTGKMLELTDLHQILSQFKPPSPIDKMDYALIYLERLSPHVGAGFKIDFENDYPLSYCSGPDELDAIIGLLRKTDFVEYYENRPFAPFSITAKGYQRLREVQRPNKMSRQCFVAMWFDKEMTDVFEKAIKPAIEYIEDGETEPRYRAIKIDNIEHVNDINDEIIAQIRRSRFIVCDLTGYRGGVYFEAGFAYGLGLDVVYTCRKDWSKEELLKDKSNNVIEFLFDAKGNKIPVKKEGIHFDLAHRNRIEWEPRKIDEFRAKLQARIKSLFFD